MRSPGALGNPEVVAGLAHDELTALVTTLRRVQARADALLLAAVGEVDARGTYAMDGAITPGSWVRAVWHATPAEAARMVRTARTLRSEALPNTAAALAAGALTGRHASVIADAVTDAPEAAVALIEPEVVTVAVEGDVRATANVMRAFQHALDPDAADEKALRRYDRAGVTLSPLLDGGFAVSGTADEVTGAVIAAAIDRAAPLVRGDTRTAARRRLDGLHAICRHWSDTATPDGDTADPTARRTGRSRAWLVVTLDGHGLAGAPSPGGTLSWAGPVTASTAARLGCDAMATFVTLDPTGTVVEAGNQRRFFTHSQRLAMIARDGDTCPAPFCDRPSAWSDGHHLVPVDQGGPTTIDNGALTCEAHHLQLHEGHWQLARLPDGRYQLQHPRTGKDRRPRTTPPRPQPATTGVGCVKNLGQFLGG